jgi:hypothetical protein
MNTGRRWSPWRFAALWLVAMTAQMLLWFPWHPQVLKPGLDSSFFYAVDELFVDGAQFADTSQNHGPYGFAKNDLYHPGTFGWLLGARVALFAVFALLAARLAALWRDSLRGGVVWIVLLVAVARFGEAYFLALALLAFLVFWSATSSEDRARWSPIVLALSLASLMKLTYAFTIGALIGLMLLSVVFELVSGWPRERKVGVAGRVGVALAWPVFYVTGVLLLWVAAGQDLARIGEFLGRWVHFSASFNESHALAGPSYRVVAYLAAAVTFWLVFAAAEIGRTGIRAGAPVLALGLGLLVVWKYTFIRHDAAHAGHGAFQALCLTVLFGLVMLRHDRAEPRAGRGAALTAIASMTVASLLLITFDRQHWYGARFFRHLDLWTTAERIEHFMREPSHIRERHQRALARIRRDSPLPPIEGPVDVYPWELSIAFAHGQAVDWRPSLVSNNADVPGMAAANARHLAARDGPTHVLFRVAPIDHRYPSLDDGPSWPVLLSDFRLRSTSGSHLVLRRATSGRRLEWSQPQTRAVGFGERLVVTHGVDRLLWTRIDPVRTARGHLFSTLARGPILYLRVELADGGQDRWYRLVPGAARAGFLLSPLVEDTAGFRSMLGGNWPRQLAQARVRALSIETEFGAGWYWGGEVRVELQELSVR